ncbi:DUF1014-domain-containing protein [Biscogniauxia sp. FL1348]|nr:DUF1014-domain-containing protein [Biscogniauxia sp. FL1348]
MAGKKGADNSKKAAGQARKAEAAASKAAAEDAKKAAAEEAEWSKGAKSNARKEAEAAKKAEQARKKAERESLLAEEEKSQPSRAAPKNKKTAVKKTNRGLDLSQLDIGDDDDNKKAEKALNATGTDAALALFDVVDGGTKVKIDRHPEKRYPAALAAYEERRMKEMTLDGSGHGLRLNQRKKLIRDEFAKSPDNPFNQVVAAHNAKREEVEAIREKENMKQENWLTSS